MTTIYLPTDTDFEQLGHEGWFVVPGLLTDAECVETLADVERAAFALALGAAADGGRWLEAPVRQRELDLVSVLASYDQR